MKIELKVPVLPESVNEALVAHWHYKVGDFIERDAPVVDIETDKVILEVAATESGILEDIIFEQGQKVSAKQILGHLNSKEIAKTLDTVRNSLSNKKNETQDQIADSSLTGTNFLLEHALRPSVRKDLQDKHINPEDVVAFFGHDRLTVDDIHNYESQKADVIASEVSDSTQPSIKSSVSISFRDREEHREKLSPLRQKIAERLLSAQHNAAALTTFNEIDMSAVIHLRDLHKGDFEKKFGVKMGFMSFFMKAVSLSLESFPSINAYIDDKEIVFHNYCDIGVAVSSQRGLVVPVIRNVSDLSFSECEANLAALAEKARKGKIQMEDLTGGTFTITNGGVFGSLLSTPILNPPQSAILGMHKIQDRPVVIDHQIVIRPMMYVALSYDHRLIDGAQAVGFLVNIKRCLEQPEQFFLHLL